MAEAAAEKRLAALEAENRALRESLGARDAGLSSNAPVAETRLTALLRHAPESIFIKDEGGRYRCVGDSFLRLIGRTAAEVLGRTDHDLFPSELAARFQAEDDEVRATNGPILFEEEVEWGGTILDFLTQKFPLPAGEVAGIATDVTARKQAEEEVRRLALRLTLATEGAGVAVYELNLATGRGAWSASAFGIIGAEAPPDLVGTYELWRRAIHPEERERVEQEHAAAAQRGGRWSTTYRVVRLDDGRTRWISAYGQFVVRDGATVSTGVAIDVSEHKLAEQALRELNNTLEERVAQRAAEIETMQEALRQAQKLEAMGQLTGGVAHDFNNLLSPIIGGLDLLQRRKVGDERARAIIAGALSAAERAKVLVQRLLAFARRQPLQPAAVDVGQLVAGLAELLASTVGPRVRVTIDAADDLPAARADPNQLDMALLNLAVNARDAMPDGGELGITLACDHLDGRSRPGLPPGRYVRIAVRDTGVGMDRATLDRAVEPFFSTKGIGKGTGLGLSMVHGLAAQLGGAMQIDSRLGHGTTVTLWLPVAQGGESAASGDDEQQAGSTGIGRALLVDDEDLVRATTGAMLRDLGYDVVEANSAAAALEIVAAGERIDLLVTDHLMSGMTGVELAYRLRGERPDLRILVISGYAEVEGIAPDLSRLTKPFRLADLAAALEGEGGAYSASPPNR